LHWQATPKDMLNAVAIAVDTAKDTRTLVLTSATIRLMLPVKCMDRLILVVFSLTTAATFLAS